MSATGVRSTELPFCWCVGPTSAEDVPNRIPPSFSPRLASADRGRQGGFRLTMEAGLSEPERAGDVGVGPADDRIPAALRQSLDSASPAGHPRGHWMHCLKGVGTLAGVAFGQFLSLIHISEPTR